ncbi:RNA polymerase sigma factor RpoH [Candidatus Cyrtobacter comes]|uniref:RNA polymerase sigma factor RpoH n=1 Tax=Candidatus Cyrtobacter comes TaxID=675776 RepID=A0ABU5L7Y9_9RICK|nr:sigma-70 family RNA polymerase sigma factor [Candidatus Cyrtobacter comes]MDZ5762248.1 RNA polymerase sigma factor RpoH [Candidatus Cyrtobacter comes]
MSLVPAYTSDLSAYIAKVSEFPLLSKEEEDVLAKKFKSDGDVKAAHMLVTSHLRLVVKIALTFRSYNVSMQDAISEGNIGLMRAVRGFDYSLGNRLSTYAMWWIKAAIQSYILRCWSALKVGSSTLQKRLFFSLGKIEDMEKRAKGVSVKDMELAGPNTVSYMGDLIGDDQLTVGDTISDDTDCENFVLDKIDNFKNKKKLEGALVTLSTRERDILVNRYSETPMTLGELGEKYSISKERVRQIESRAITTIRDEILKGKVC